MSDLADNKEPTTQTASMARPGGVTDWLPDRAAAALAGVIEFSRQRPLLAWLIGSLLISLVCMLLIDQPLHAFIREHASDKTRGFFYRVGDIAAGNMWWFITVGVLAIGYGAQPLIWRIPTLAGRLRQWADSAYFVVCTLIVSGVVVMVSKGVFGRPRPSSYDEHGHYAFDILSFDTGEGAFPSGHTQAAVALMLALYYVFPRYDLLFFSLAALTAVGRLVTGQHFLADVVFGAYIGIAGVIVVKRWFDRRGINVQISPPPGIRNGPST